MSTLWLWLAFCATAILVSSFAVGWIAKRVNWSPSRCYHTVKWLVALCALCATPRGTVGEENCIPGDWIGCGPDEPLVPRGDRLRTGDDIDDQYAVRVPETGRDWIALAAMLVAKRAPPTNYMISRDRRLNGAYLPLNEAIESACSGAGATLVSRIPGKLGFSAVWTLTSPVC
jgi:hypothetical protein